VRKTGAGGRLQKTKRKFPGVPWCGPTYTKAPQTNATPGRRKVVAFKKRWPRCGARKKKIQGSQIVRQKGKKYPSQGGVVNNWKVGHGQKKKSKDSLIARVRQTSCTHNQYQGREDRGLKTTKGSRRKNCRCGGCQKDVT